MPPSPGGRSSSRGSSQKPLPYDVVLDEIAESGYAGTELGDWGFMPTDPAVLREELDRRGLALLGAFVPVLLRDPDALTAGIEHALRVARLLAAVAGEGDRRNGPFVVVADDNATDPVRTLHAGRITPEMELPDEEWAGYAGRAEAVARAVREETGLRSVFHPHSAGWVETPSETDRFLAETDPAVDRHRLRHRALPLRRGRRRGRRWSRPWTAGGTASGTSISRIAIWDWPAARAKRDGATSRRYAPGIFSELGKGDVDFPAVVRWLRDHGYDGWVVVEQDVLPGMGTPKESARRNREYLASLGL